MFITILLFIILIILVWNYYVHYGRNGRLINLIPGPVGYPIAGNVLQFLGSQEKRWKLMTTLPNQYYPIFKIWAFFLPIVSICHPDDLQTILSSTKHIERKLTLNVLQPLFGTGLLTSSGDKWHSRRKLLTPTFNFNILQQFVKVFIEEGEKMTKSLKKTEGIVVKDLIPFLSEHTLNAICETAMGTSTQDLSAFLQRYKKTFLRISELLNYRLMRPWLYSDWIFSLTPEGREQAKILKIFHGITEKIIAEKKLYHERTSGQYLKNIDNDVSAEDAETTGARKKRLAMLDVLIAAFREGLMTDSDIREEVDTFMFAGHDTTSMTISFILALLAEHKDIQECVRNEIDAAMQENEGKITMKSLQQLSYLERCIKEGMRLYPVAASIARITEEDVKLQSYLIPAGTVVQLLIYQAHRDPNFWPDPEVFDPDRFLSGNTRNRHPYSYIPFSAGSRNCIGQKYALLEIKAMLAHLIQNFYVEPVDYLKDLQLEVDIILHPSRPIRVKFVPIS